MEKFLDLILGTNDIPTYMAGLIFVILGMVLFYRTKIKKRDKNSSNTPRAFSLKFFLRDNLVDILFSLLAALMIMRFSTEFMGVEITMWYSFLLGVGSSKLVDMIVSYQSKARDNV